MPPTPPTRWISSALSLVLGALLLSAAPVAAGGPTIPPPPLSSGKVGVFRLVESADGPSVVCSYDDPTDPDSNNYLYRVAAAAPRVKAAHGRTSQKVAWRLTVQTWDQGANSWIGVKRSGWTSATATGSSAAPLAKRSVGLRTYDLPDGWGWRAKVEIRWFAADKQTISGRGTFWASWYTNHQPPSPDWLSTNPWCGWTTG